MSSDLLAQTPEAILAALGYPEPLDAARQHGRMILLGKLAHYEAELQRLSAKWGRTLDQMRASYSQLGEEQPDADDDYIQWQWYTDAVTEVQRQLRILAKPA